MDRGRRAAIAVAAALGVAAALTIATPAHAATTATAWVSSFSVNYQAGTGQANSVTTAKVVNSSGTWWQFTDLVFITAGSGCHHPYRGNPKVVWCATGTAQAIAVATGDLDDTIDVQTPGTVVYAGAGADAIRTVRSASMWTIAHGEDGADTVFSEAGTDHIDGGPGLDTVSYAGRTAHLHLSLVTDNGGPKVGGGYTVEDTYAGIENVTGGWGGDALFGGGSANVLDGGPGGDALHGGAGADTLLGGAGNDVLYGDDGDDGLYGQDGDDTLWGYAGGDLLNGGNGYDQCFPHSGEWIGGCEKVIWS